MYFLVALGFFGCLSGVGADKKSRARRAEDSAARGGGVEEVGGEGVGVGLCVGDAVPVDLAPRSAERPVRPGDRTAAHRGAKRVARGRD